MTSLGLFYTTLSQGADRLQIPNNVLLSLAVVPLREPEKVDVQRPLPAATPARARSSSSCCARSPCRPATGRASRSRKSTPTASILRIDGDAAARRGRLAAGRGGPRGPAPPRHRRTGRPRPPPLPRARRLSHGDGSRARRRLGAAVDGTRCIPGVSETTRGRLWRLRDARGPGSSNGGFVDGGTRHRPRRLAGDGPGAVPSARRSENVRRVRARSSAEEVRRLPQRPASSRPLCPPRM